MSGFGQHMNSHTPDWVVVVNIHFGKGFKDFQGNIGGAAD